jgi:hypothetical protein
VGIQIEIVSVLVFKRGRRIEEHSRVREQTSSTITCIQCAGNICESIRILIKECLGTTLSDSERSVSEPALRVTEIIDLQLPSSHRSRLQLDTAYTETKTPSFGIVIELEVDSELLTGKRQRILLQNNIVAGTRQENKTHGSVACSASTSSSSLAADVSKLSCDLNAAQLVATQKPKKLQKKARFAETPHVKGQQVPRPSMSSSSLAPSTLGSEEKLLRNLCAELRLIPVVGLCTGYIIGDGGQRHYLTIKTRQECNLLLPRTASLEDLLLRRNGLEFRRQNRYQVGSILASSLLHLYTTPWMARMEKRNIVFPRNGLVISIDCPYILQSFKKLVPNTAATTQQAKATQTTGANS